MHKIEKGELRTDIIAWQKLRKITVSVYSLFSESRDFGFRDQTQRAYASATNNITGDFERRTNNEFNHFLFIAKGSWGEVRLMFFLAKIPFKILQKSCCLTKGFR